MSAGTGFDRQIDANGRTVADSIRDEVENADYRLITVVQYLDLIADCLATLAWKASPDAGARQSRLEEIRRHRGESR